MPLSGEQITPPELGEAEGGTWETDPLIGGMIGGRYRVRGVVGRGGMGIVYDAIHEELGRSVAIKVVSAEHANDSKVIDRFLREARVVAQIGHQNIVDVHDLGRLEDQRPYLVMERIYGPSFYELLQLHGRMEPMRVAELLDGVGAALEVVHSKGIIHRDIKLENLMLARLEDGSTMVKLLDFGIAAFSQHAPDAKRITAQGMITGTPLYIAPEAASGERPDHRADIYSLAVVAYMMLTGFAPFDSENPVMVLLKKLSEAPPKLSSGELTFTQVLEDVIARGLARSPEDRYQSARDFVRDIRNASQAPAVVAVAESNDFADATEIVRDQRPTIVAVRTPMRLPEPEASAESDLDPDVETEPGGPPPSSTAELYKAALPDPIASMKRIAMFAMPLFAIVVAVFAIRSLHSPSEPANEPKAVLLPVKVISEPVRGAREVEQPPPPVDVEPTKVVEHVEPKPELKPVEEKPAKQKILVIPTLIEEKKILTKRKPVQEDAPPKVTLPAADLARAEAAAQEGMKALISGRLPSAIEAFREATNAAPRYAAAWKGLGLANEKMGRRSEALEAFEQYLRLSSGENPGVIREIEQRVEKLKGL